ncbi:MAG TPA: septal ring lytic transglycosylase RlpA family protein [Nitrospirales bacterium]|nr:septal ring lytic transglycosylase RlpA family protein [Nitrospirales bacterium]
MRPGLKTAAFLLGCSILSGCSLLPKGVADLDVGIKERGIASWYGDDFHGWVTASGEMYDMHALSGAHRTLPLGTVVRVTNVVNGKHVVIRINDRGPYVNGRILDLSYGAARKLGMVTDGVAAVHLQVIGQDAFPSLAEERLHDGMAFAIPGDQDRAWRSAVMYRLLNPVTTRTDRDYRTISHDVLRERRSRRVADILAADRCVDVVASLHLA